MSILSRAGASIKYAREVALREQQLREQSTISINNGEIILPDSVDGKDRYLIVEKKTNETVSPLVKKSITIDGVYEVVDRNFSYPLTAHVGLKFDARSFANIPSREYDVKMKKVKVPSNYFPLGGNGLDRRYVYANPEYPANPTTLDLIFMIDQNMNYATRSLIKRNLGEFLSKLIAGYTNVRASIWQTSSSISTVINPSNNDAINNFTYFETDLFFELEVPDSAGNNQTNLYKRLTDALADNNQITPANDPAETAIANFFLRKSQFSVTDQVGVKAEDEVLESIWKNTVRKVIYFSGSTPEIMEPSTYQVLLNHARENGIQFYYFYTDAQFSGTRTLRELSNDSGGGSFNMQHDSDIKLQEFCDNNFYDSNKIYYGDWDGTFKIAWTDNPAWVLYDIITNVDYGLGNYIEYKSVDKWTLYDIGRYCDAVDDDGRFRGVKDGRGGLEPRYTCNIFFVNKDEAYKVIQDIAAIFKGIAFWSMEGFSFSADKSKNPIMYFANTNVKEGVFNYSETARNKRFTYVEVVYNDKYDNFKSKIEIVDDADGIRQYGMNPFKVNAAGCTSRSEARRIGKYVICSSMFEADTVSFSAGLEAAYLQVGDVFGVSDEVKNIARTFGRILEINTGANSLKIDGEFQNGLASGIFIHVPSGNYSLTDLNNLTANDGSFTGDLESIRNKRQKQARSFNIHTVQDDAYGATITVTGDFLIESVKTQVYPRVGRISGAGVVTGETTLTGLVYKFPDHTVLQGNPRWDSVTYENVTGVFSQNNIDITLSGEAGTGQLINSVANWTGEIAFNSSTNSTLTINNSVVGVSSSNEIRMFRISAAGAVEASGAINSLNDFWSNSVYTSADQDEVVLVYTKGNQISNTFVPNNTWSTGVAATEIFKIGDDVSNASSNFGYAGVIVKNGHRILERASKANNETGKIKFTYRDLLAYSKLRPFYTITQADVGNSQPSSFSEWITGKNYVIGNKVKLTSGGVSTAYVCTRSHMSSSSFGLDYIEGNATRSKWAKGNNEGYSTIGFPKNFPCLSTNGSKVYLNETLNSTHIASAFQKLGVDVYVGAGSLGQSDIANLSEANGLGYSGLIIGTGYPKGFYDLVVNTNPVNLDTVPNGSLYVLSGIGVEPKLYKTIGIKEEEANSYSVIGIQYLNEKEKLIENDALDTSPSYYVQSPYDVVIKPERPSRVTAATLTYNPSNIPTGLNLAWIASTSPINGYKVYISKPDYSTLQDDDSISEPYFVPSGTQTLTIPINEIWGQYDVSVYSQGILPYKLLSLTPAPTSLFVLPPATLVGNGGFSINSTMVSGFTVDTADTKSINYQISNSALGVVGVGRGNFTSKNLTFRWKYIDPTGGIIDSVERMQANPFLDLPPDITVQVLDEAYQPLTEPIKSFDRFSYTITEDDNKRLVSREKNDFENINPTRNLGLRVVVTDNTKNTKTGTFLAYNVKPSYSSIEVIDSFQNSPYYILSGYFGNSTTSKLAFWGSGENGVLGSGIRNYITNSLLRSEDETREIMFEDISGAFKHATYYDGATLRTGINISHRGSGEIDFKAYVYANDDLIKHYNEEVKGDIPIEIWGSGHYNQYGKNEPREVPRILGNPLGLSNFGDITQNTKTGFSDITFTVLTEQVSKGEIIFNCYSNTSNKDVLYVDVFTGASADFSPDILNLTNFYGAETLYETRSYYNQLRLSDRLATGVWHYFKFVPWDDFGAGEISAVASGYLEELPVERRVTAIRSLSMDGGRDETIEFTPTTAKLVRGFRYLIKNIGTVNWASIGVTTTPAVELEFEYNGVSVLDNDGFAVQEGNAAKVRRVETKTNLLDTDMDRIIAVAPVTASTAVLPATIDDGSSVTLINKGDKNLYIENSEGETVTVIRPGERSDIIRIDDKWIDPRGNDLFIER